MMRSDWKAFLQVVLEIEFWLENFDLMLKVCNDGCLKLDWRRHAKEYVYTRLHDPEADVFESEHALIRFKDL